MEESTKLQELETVLDETIVISDKLRSFIFNCAVKGAEINKGGQKENREFDQTWNIRVNQELEKLGIFSDGFIQQMQYMTYLVANEAWEK